MARCAMRACYVFAMCVALAYLEVQIEGPNGWASALPTWRSTNPAVTWVFGGRPVTGYHVGLNVFLLLALHWPLLFKRWTLVDECRVLQSFAVMAFVWDFLWFVLNPSFGLRRYDAAHVWWFRRWVLGVPSDYWIGAGAAVFLRLLPALMRREPMALAVREGVVGVVIPVLGAAVVALATLLIGSVR
jgi:hypothetical protein